MSVATAVKSNRPVISMSNKTKIKTVLNDSQQRHKLRDELLNVAIAMYLERATNINTNWKSLKDQIKENHKDDDLVATYVDNINNASLDHVTDTLLM